GAARDALAQAVLAGLARYPDQIPRHAEALMGLAPDDPRLSQAISTLLERAGTLDAGASDPISAPAIPAPPADSARYSFLVEGTETPGARGGLAGAVSLRVERPALEAAIAAATARFETAPEGAF